MSNSAFPNSQGNSASAIPVYGASSTATFKQSAATGMTATTETALLAGMPVPALVTFLTTTGSIQITPTAGGVPYTPPYDAQGTVTGQIVLTLGVAPYSITFTGTVGDKWSIK